MSTDKYKIRKIRVSWVGQSTRGSAALCKFDSTDCMYFYLYSQSKFIGFSWIQMMCHFCSTGRDQKVVENFLSALDCPPNRFFSRCMWVTKYPQLHHCRRDPLFYLNIIQKMKGEWYNQEGASPLLSLSSSLHLKRKPLFQEPQEMTKFLFNLGHKLFLKGSSSKIRRHILMQFQEFEEGAGCKFSTGIGWKPISRF